MFLKILGKNNLNWGYFNITIHYIYVYYNYKNNWNAVSVLINKKYLIRYKSKIFVLLSLQQMVLCALQINARYISHVRNTKHATEPLMFIIFIERICIMELLM